MPYDGRYDQIFDDAGREWNVDPQLLKAVMLQESGGDPNAVSKAGARGLMQFMDDTGKRMGITDPFDPAQSIFASAKFMDQLLQQYGSPEKALVAYSGGASNYVPNVTANYVKLARATKPAAAPAATNAPSSQKAGSDLDSLVGPAPSTAAASAPDTGAAPVATPGAAANKPPSAASKPGSDLDSLVGPAPEVPQQEEQPPAETPPMVGYIGPDGSWMPAPSTMPGTASPDEQRAALARVGEAAKQGFLNAPSAGTAPGNINVLTPGTQDWLGRNVPVVGPLVNAAGGLAGVAVGAMGALGAGAGQAGNELLQMSHLPGNLQRDINLGAQAAPAFLAGPEASIGRSALANSPHDIATAPRLPDYAPGVNALDPAVAQRAAMRDTLRGIRREPGTEPPPSSPTGVEPPPEPPPSSAGGSWRPVGPDDVFGPGRQFRMNPNTGQSEVFEPGGAKAAGAQAEPSATAAPDVPLRGARTSAEGKAVAGTYYDAAEKGGSADYTAQFANKFIDRLKSSAPQTPQGIAAAGPNEVAQLAQRMEAVRDQPMSLKAVQEVDEQISRLIEKEVQPNGKLSQDGQQLAEAQSQLRNMAENPAAGDTTGGDTGYQNLVNARKAWSQAMKMQDVERMQARAAGMQNPTSSFQTYVNNYLQSARSRGWTDAEKASLRSAANRGAVGGALHMLGGRLVPYAAMAGDLAGGGGAFSTILHGLGAHAAGAAVRGTANKLAARRQGRVFTTLGRSVPNPLNPQP